mgnify:CR=1 FL=1
MDLVGATGTASPTVAPASRLVLNADDIEEP